MSKISNLSTSNFSHFWIVSDSLVYQIQGATQSNMYSLTNTFSTTLITIERAASRQLGTISKSTYHTDLIHHHKCNSAIAPQ